MSQAGDSARGGSHVPAELFIEASVTLLATLFACLALDDITTDNATTGFVPEYTFLVICGAWGLFFGFRLWAVGRRALSAGSLLLLGAAAWVARDGIGHKYAGGWSAFWPEYSTITITWLWFTAVAVVLLARAVRGESTAAASGASGRT